MEDKEKGIENPAFVEDIDHIEEIPAKPIPEESEDFEDLPDPEFNVVQKWMDKIHQFFAQVFNQDSDKFQDKIQFFKWISIGLAFHIYFICAIFHFTQSEKENLGWCEGLGFLIILTLMVDLSLIYGYLIKPTLKKLINTKSGHKILESTKEKYQEISGKSWFSIALILFTISLIFLFLIIDTWNDQRRLRSFFGLIVFVFLAVMFSNNPARIR